MLLVKSALFFVYAAHILYRLRALPALRLCFIEPGIDATEFVDVGATQLGQRGGGGLAAVSTAAVNQHRGVLFRDHLGGSCFVNGTHRNQDSAGDVVAVVLVLIPHIKDDDLMGVHHLFGFFLGNLLVGTRGGIPAASGQQQKENE